MTDTSRYAVPLTALVGGAHVAFTEHVEILDETQPDWVPGVQFPVVPMGGDADGD